MVDKLLFSPWFESELKNPMATSQKAGWSPLPGGYQRLVREFPLDSSIAVDKSLWDWTMPSWVIKAYVDLKFYQMVDPDDRIRRLTWARLSQVLGPNSRFRLSTGVEYRQTFWGVMKSGWLLTLSLNSAAQVFQHALAWMRMGRSASPLPTVWAMGDDILAKLKLSGEELQLYWDSLESTGCQVKKIERRREFCGFVFEDDSVVPLYPDKHRFLLRHLKPANVQSTLLSFELLYALSSDRWFDQCNFERDLILGPMAKLWAKGLIHLDVLSALPDWTEF